MNDSEITEAKLRFMASWDSGRGYSFAPWVKSCGENVGKLKAQGVEHLSEKPQGRWVDGEWVAAS